MTEPSAHDPEVVRVGRLFADLMLTLAEDGVGGVEAVTLTAPLSAALPREHGRRSHDGLRPAGRPAGGRASGAWAGQLPGDGLERAARGSAGVARLQLGGLAHPRRSRHVAFSPWFR